MRPSAIPATMPPSSVSLAANLSITWRSVRSLQTGSKRNPDPLVGVEEIQRCRSLIEKPLVAIGGITLENALDVLRAGADSVAVIAGFAARCSHSSIDAQTNGRMEPACQGRVIAYIHLPDLCYLCRVARPR